jgi:hypothetical protein
MEDEDKYRQINAEKIIGDQNSHFGTSSRGENRSRTLNNGAG